MAVLDAQRVTVSPKVFGLLGTNVTLPCTFNSEKTSFSLTQVQWERESQKILVYDPMYGLNVSSSALSGRLKLVNTSKVDGSIHIRNVSMSDGGEYTCRVTTFPDGSYFGTTKLIVHGKNTSLL